MVQDKDSAAVIPSRSVHAETVRAQIVTAKVTFSNNFAPAYKCERESATANCPCRGEH